MRQYTIVCNEVCNDFSRDIYYAKTFCSLMMAALCAYVQTATFYWTPFILRINSFLIFRKRLDNVHEHIDGIIRVKGRTYNSITFTTFVNAYLSIMLH